MVKNEVWDEFPLYLVYMEIPEIHLLWLIHGLAFWLLGHRAGVDMGGSSHIMMNLQV